MSACLYVCMYVCIFVCESESVNVDERVYVSMYVGV